MTRTRKIMAVILAAMVMVSLIGTSLAFAEDENDSGDYNPIVEGSDELPDDEPIFNTLDAPIGAGDNLNPRVEIALNYTDIVAPDTASSVNLTGGRKLSGDSGITLRTRLSYRVVMFTYDDELEPDAVVLRYNTYLPDELGEPTYDLTSTGFDGVYSNGVLTLTNNVDLLPGDSGSIVFYTTFTPRGLVSPASGIFSGTAFAESEVTFGGSVVYNASTLPITLDFEVAKDTHELVHDVRRTDRITSDPADAAEAYEYFDYYVSVDMLKLTREVINAKITDVLPASFDLLSVTDAKTSALLFDKTTKPSGADGFTYTPSGTIFTYTFDPIAYWGRYPTVTEGIMKLKIRARALRADVQNSVGAALRTSVIRLEGVYEGDSAFSLLDQESILVGVDTVYFKYSGGIYALVIGARNADVSNNPDNMYDDRAHGGISEEDMPIWQKKDGINVMGLVNNNIVKTYVFNGLKAAVTAPIDYAWGSDHIRYINQSESRVLADDEFRITRILVGSTRGEYIETDYGNREKDVYVRYAGTEEYVFFEHLSAWENDIAISVDTNVVGFRVISRNHTAAFGDVADITRKQVGEIEVTYLKSDRYVNDALQDSRFFIMGFMDVLDSDSQESVLNITEDTYNGTLAGDIKAYDLAHYGKYMYRSRVSTYLVKKTYRPLMWGEGVNPTKFDESRGVYTFKSLFTLYNTTYADSIANFDMYTLMPPGVGFDSLYVDTYTSTMPITTDWSVVNTDYQGSGRTLAKLSVRTPGSADDVKNQAITLFRIGINGYFTEPKSGDYTSKATNMFFYPMDDITDAQLTERTTAGGENTVSSAGFAPESIVAKYTTTESNKDPSGYGYLDPYSEAILTDLNGNGNSNDLVIAAYNRVLYPITALQGTMGVRKTAVTDINPVASTNAGLVNSNGTYAFILSLSHNDVALTNIKVYDNLPSVGDTFYKLGSNDSLVPRKSRWSGALTGVSFITPPGKTLNGTQKVYYSATATTVTNLSSAPWVLSTSWAQPLSAVKAVAVDFGTNEIPAKNVYSVRLDFKAPLDPTFTLAGTATVNTFHYNYNTLGAEILESNAATLTMKSPKAVIGDTIFADYNENGIMDGDDHAIPATLTLYKKLEDGDTTTPSLTMDGKKFIEVYTSATGGAPYLFTQMYTKDSDGKTYTTPIQQGEYYIKVTLSSTPWSSRFKGFTVIPDNPGADVNANAAVADGVSGVGWIKNIVIDFSDNGSNGADIEYLKADAGVKFVPADADTAFHKVSQDELDGSPLSVHVLGEQTSFKLYRVEHYPNISGTPSSSTIKDYSVPAHNFKVEEFPEPGLLFSGVSIPAYRKVPLNAEGYATKPERTAAVPLASGEVVYTLKYKTNLDSTLKPMPGASNIDAREAHTLENTAKLKSGEYITYLVIDFGNVPAIFYAEGSTVYSGKTYGNPITFTFNLANDFTKFTPVAGQAYRQSTNTAKLSYGYTLSGKEYDYSKTDDANVLVASPVSLPRELDKSAIFPDAPLGGEAKFSITKVQNYDPASVYLFTLEDTPQVGLTWERMTLPQFTNGEGVTYSVYYNTSASTAFVALSGYNGLSADSEQLITFPSDLGTITIRTVQLRFGTVPIAFAQTDDIITVFGVDSTIATYPTGTAKNDVKLTYQYNSEPVSVTDDATVIIVEAPTFTITKSADQPALVYQPGEQVPDPLRSDVNGGYILRSTPIEYTIIVTPTGAGTFTVDDVVPAGTELVGAPSGNGSVGDDGKITWNTTVSASGLSPITFKFTVSILDSLEEYAIISNTAKLIVGTAETGSETIVHKVADPHLTITKSADPEENSTVPQGDTIIYTLLVENGGKLPATNVVVTDSVPTGTTFQSADNNGDESLGTITWNLGTLAAGTDETVTFTVTVDELEEETYYLVIDNTAAVTSDDTSDDSNTVIHEVKEPHLTITKSSSGAGITTFKPGDTITYTIVVENDGAYAIPAATVTDSAPPHTTLDSVGNGGEVSNGVITWTLPLLEIGDTYTVKFTVTADEFAVGTDVYSRDINNTASVTSDETGTTVSNEVVDPVAIPTPNTVSYPDTTPKPSSSPTPSPSETPEPSETPDPESTPEASPDASAEPSTEPSPEVTPYNSYEPRPSAPIDEPRLSPTSTPPTPREGNVLVHNDDDSWTEFDEYGVPMGTWTWNESTETWDFKEFVPTGAKSPRTGDLGFAMWLIIGGAASGVAATISYAKKRRGK
ncbi:MAG: DUF11 domain-containing protein [Oscillospiraceae bacterium]|jgi:uncharacterized repeat protein (TIGR01451 family)|nr:DUF11 domain-containing protein [Oscillospiraceae bacterium]